MTNFHIDDIAADLAVVRVVGRLNMISAPRLRDMVTQAVETGRTRLVVDLSGVEFMDSSGLGALIGGLKPTRQAGGDLRIAAPGEQVMMVLQLSNVDRILKPYENPHDAFAE